MIRIIFITLHKSNADSDRNDRQSTEDQVGVEQESWLLVEELFVVIELIEVTSTWDQIPVDHVIVPVEYKIENLLGANEYTAADENWRVKVFIATSCPVDTAEETGEQQVEEDAATHEDVVHLSLKDVRLRWRALIHHDTESEEMAIWTQQQVHVDTRHVVPNELIDKEVDKTAALEDE